MGGRKGRALSRIESAVVVSLAVVLSLGSWWWTSRRPPDEPTPVAPSETTVAQEIEWVTVHVAGEVRRPGVVRLQAGSRVVDAVEAAGGATAGARLAALNLAAPLVDGGQVLVPSVETQPSTAVVDDGIVVVNQATASELERLPGVGPVLAGRIIAHRDEHGPFETPEDLLDVPGIGESILSELRPLIRIP